MVFVTEFLYCHGSSPRVRGTPLCEASSHNCHRFIPARAGNTRNYRTDTADPAVHPRACGEHISIATLNAAKDGSSPRVRGTPQQATQGRRRGGFIPARAGNTSPVTDEDIEATVHPRACGEHVNQ